MMHKKKRWTAAMHATTQSSVQSPLLTTTTSQSKGQWPTHPHPGIRHTPNVAQMNNQLPTTNALTENSFSVVPTPSLFAPNRIGAVESAIPGIKPTAHSTRPQYSSDASSVHTTSINRSDLSSNLIAAITQSPEFLQQSGLLLQILPQEYIEKYTKSLEKRANASTKPSLTQNHSSASTHMNKSCDPGLSSTMARVSQSGHCARSGPTTSTEYQTNAFQVTNPNSLAFQGSLNRPSAMDTSKSLRPISNSRVAHPTANPQTSVFVSSTNGPIVSAQRLTSPLRRPSGSTDPSHKTWNTPTQQQLSQSPSMTGLEYSTIAAVARAANLFQPSNKMNAAATAAAVLSQLDTVNQMALLSHARCNVSRPESVGSVQSITIPSSTISAGLPMSGGYIECSDMNGPIYRSNNNSSAETMKHWNNANNNNNSPSIPVTRVHTPNHPAAHNTAPDIGRRPNSTNRSPVISRSPDACHNHQRPLSQTLPTPSMNAPPTSNVFRTNPQWLQQPQHPHIQTPPLQPTLPPLTTTTTTAATEYRSIPPDPLGSTNGSSDSLPMPVESAAAADARLSILHDAKVAALSVDWPSGLVRPQRSRTPSTTIMFTSPPPPPLSSVCTASPSFSSSSSCSIAVPGFVTTKPSSGLHHIPVTLPPSHMMVPPPQQSIQSNRQRRISTSSVDLMPPSGALFTGGQSGQPILKPTSIPLSPSAGVVTMLNKSHLLSPPALDHQYHQYHHHQQQHHHPSSPSSIVGKKAPPVSSSNNNNNIIYRSNQIAPSVPMLAHKYNHNNTSPLEEPKLVAEPVTMGTSNYHKTTPISTDSRTVAPRSLMPLKKRLIQRYEADTESIRPLPPPVSSPPQPPPPPPQQSRASTKDSIGTEDWKPVMVTGSTNWPTSSPKREGVHQTELKVEKSEWGIMPQLGSEVDRVKIEPKTEAPTLKPRKNAKSRHRLEANEGDSQLTVDQKDGSQLSFPGGTKRGAVIKPTRKNNPRGSGTSAGTRRASSKASKKIVEHPLMSGRNQTRHPRGRHTNRRNNTTELLNEEDTPRRRMAAVNGNLMMMMTASRMTRSNSSGSSCSSLQSVEAGGEESDLDRPRTNHIRTTGATRGHKSGRGHMRHKPMDTDPLGSRSSKSTGLLGDRVRKPKRAAALVASAATAASGVKRARLTSVSTIESDGRTGRTTTTDGAREEDDDLDSTLSADDASSVLTTSIDGRAVTAPTTGHAGLAMDELSAVLGEEKLSLDQLIRQLPDPPDLQQLTSRSLHLPYSLDHYKRTHEAFVQLVSCNDPGLKQVPKCRACRQVKNPQAGEEDEDVINSSNNNNHDDDATVAATAETPGSINDTFGETKYSKLLHTTTEQRPSGDTDEGCVDDDGEASVRSSDSEAVGVERRGKLTNSSTPPFKRPTGRNSAVAAVDRPKSNESAGCTRANERLRTSSSSSSTTTTSASAKRSAAAAAATASPQGVSVFCRFWGFRKLVFNDRGVLKIAGFCHYNEASDEDRSLWEMHDQAPTKLGVDHAKYIVERAGMLFCRLLRQELAVLSASRSPATLGRGNKNGIRATNASQGLSIPVLWKRPVKGVREMCDVCETTMFNTHWVCAKCGYSVCVHCQEEAKSSHSTTSTTATSMAARRSRLAAAAAAAAASAAAAAAAAIASSGSREDGETATMDTTSSITNGTESDASPEKKVKRTKVRLGPIGWASCTTTRQHHDPHRLMLTALLPASTVGRLLHRVHRIARNYHIRLECSCDTPLTDSISATSESAMALGGSVDPLKSEDDQAVSEASSLDLLAELALKSEAKSGVMTGMSTCPSRASASIGEEEEELDLDEPILPLAGSPHSWIHASRPLDKGVRVLQLHIPTDEAVWSDSLEAFQIGTTNLHVDIADAINILLYVGQPSIDTPEAVQNAEAVLNTIRQAHTDPVYLDRTQRWTDRLRRHAESGEKVKPEKMDKDSATHAGDAAPPGALWHIFLPEDMPQLREFLSRITLEQTGKPQDPGSDPVHDQLFYLDQQLLDRLYACTGVAPCTLVQFIGEAVFIPAGAAHQVRNLNSCIKAAVDFVSPEHLTQCFQLIEEFRRLSPTHQNHEDKLQVKNMLFHAIKDALSVLLLNTQHQQPTSWSPSSDSRIEHHPPSDTTGGHAPFVHRLTRLCGAGRVGGTQQSTGRTLMNASLLDIQTNPIRQLQQHSNSIMTVDSDSSERSVDPSRRPGRPPTSGSAQRRRGTNRVKVNNTSIRGPSPMVVDPDATSNSRSESLASLCSKKSEVLST